MADQPSVVTVGNFDGVHLGHAALLARARAVADGCGGRVVALSFDPHPIAALRPGAEPARLTSFARREALLQRAGADEVVRLSPTSDLLGQSPEEFVLGLLSRYSAVAMVEGEDFRFGRARVGDVDALRHLGERHGFGVEVVPPVEATLTDHTVVVASSSVTRWLLSRGRVRDAAAVLGRAYELEGEVERGDRRGRRIGYPTANLRCECVLPGDGVYAGRAVLQDGRCFGAALSVGTKPTFDGRSRAMEVYLLDAPMREDGSGAIEGLDEYGWRMRVTFEGWVREQVRFESVETLVEQMGRDCARVRWMVDGAGAETGATAGADDPAAAGGVSAAGVSGDSR